MAEQDSRRSSEDDFSEEDVMAWLCVGDDDDQEAETADEISKLLDSPAESATATATQVRFIADPYSSPTIFQSSTSYVTINGNEESCGSSFSEGESSLMASVDTRGMVSVGGGGGGFLAWGTSEKGIDGCDAFDWDWEDGGMMNEAEMVSFLGEELFEFDPIF